MFVVDHRHAAKVRFPSDCVAKLDGFVDEGRPRVFGWPLSRAPVRGVANLHRQHPSDATPTLSKRLRGEERGRGA
jgi:hypothetical protein